MLQVLTTFETLSSEWRSTDPIECSPLMQASRDAGGMGMGRPEALGLRAASACKSGHWVESCAAQVEVFRPPCLAGALAARGLRRGPLHRLYGNDQQAAGGCLSASLACTPCRMPPPGRFRSGPPCGRALPACAACAELPCALCMCVCLLSFVTCNLCALNPLNLRCPRPLQMAIALHAERRWIMTGGCLEGAGARSRVLAARLLWLDMGVAHATPSLV